MVYGLFIVQYLSLDIISTGSQIRLGLFYIHVPLIVEGRR